MDNKMKFAQWANLSPHKNLKFHKFCQFKELDEDALMEMARLRVTPEGIERPEFRKVPYLLDSFVLFCLAQIPQSLWAEALSYLHDWGIHKVQQEMKNIGIKPLMRVENPYSTTPQEGETPKQTPYLGVTGGTPEEKQKYNEIRTFLMRKPPYDFIKLSGHTFLVVSQTDVHPISYMYMKIDNSANDKILQHQETIDKADRDQYIKAGHGLHSGFLNTFDPPEKTDGEYPHHVWTGYRGLNQASASKWLSRYYDNLNWYHMASSSDTDNPIKVQRRRDQYEAIKNNPLLLHPRTNQKAEKGGGAKPRRESALPILSGMMLQRDIGRINARRNAVMSQREKACKRWQINIENGQSNIDIGITARHNNVFNTFKIPLQKANQIKQLLQNPQLVDIASTSGFYSTSEYIAEKVKLEGKKVGNFTYTPKQIIDAIIADTKNYDACVYPYWDNAGVLHSSTTEGHHPYVQTKIKVAPEKFIPREKYVLAHTHQLMSTVAEEMIKSGEKFNSGEEAESETRANFQKFLALLRTIPETKPEASEDGTYSPEDFPAVIRAYAQQLRNADVAKIIWPKQYVTQELTNAGYDIYQAKAKSKALQTEAREPTKVKTKLEKDPSEKRKNKAWGPLIDGMETALLARTFKYWFQYLRGRKPGEFNMSASPPTLPNSFNQIVELLKEFIDFNNKRAGHVMQNTRTADEFDYSLNFIHDKGEKYISSGWDMGQGDPLTIYGDDEDYEDLLEVCKEGWVFIKALSSVRGFLMGGVQEQNRQEQGENPRNKLTSMQHPENRRLLMDLEVEVTNEALSEFKHTKTGIKPIFNYLRLRRQLVKEGGEIDKNTGEIENIKTNDPIRREFEKARTVFLTVLHDNVQNFTKRLWQLDFGYGSRRTVGRGPKTQQGGEMFDIGGGTKVSEQSKEQLESRYGAAYAFLLEPPKSRTFQERGPESKGQIFSTSLRRQKAQSDEYIEKVQNGLLQIEKETGVRPDRTKAGFMDEVMRLVQAMHTSRKKSLSYVVEVAEREKYHALQNSPTFASMSPNEIEDEVKKYGRLKAKMFMDQLDQVHTACPNMEVVSQKMGDRWKVLNRTSRVILSNMQYRIDKDFFDADGNLKPMGAKYLKEYLQILSGVAAYALTGNVPNYKEEYSEITDAIDEIREENERAQAPKAQKLSEDQKAAFRLGLRRFTALFYNVLRIETTAIAGSRKDTIETDLKSLADDRVLSVDSDWLNTAENILRTKHHYDQPIPADLFGKYATAIQKAVNIAKQRVA